MCGRLNVTDSPGLRSLCDQLDIDLWPAQGMRYSRFIRATERVSIVYRQDDKTVMNNAIWWLLLDKHVDSPSGFKPSKYTSFNTRYDKLNTPRSAGYHAFRQQRCVIPATGFGETLAKDGQKIYHDMTCANDEAMAMGGLYRTWQYTDEQGAHHSEMSCSVVTLPPHQALANVHTKASPLMLSLHDGSLQTWLDPQQTPESLEYLLAPAIRHQLEATPIDKPSTYQPVGPAFSLAPD